MKKILFTFSLFLLIGCVEKKQSKKEKTVVAYNETDYFHYENKKVKIIIKDTMCSYEKSRAISDIKKGKIKIYFSFLNFKRKLGIHNAYLKIGKYLSRYNIAVDTIIDQYSSGCIHTDKFERYCYQNEMKNEITRKHGEKFLDSLCYLVEKDYVKKNLNKIYEFTQCDMISRYPNTKDYNDMFDKSESDFFKQFEYPIGYKYKNERSYSYTTASFNLSKTGKISNLNTKAHLQNPLNQKYKSYFESEVAKFIKKIKFIPAQSCGIPVNSKMELSFTNK